MMRSEDFYLGEAHAHQMMARRHADTAMRHRFDGRNPAEANSEARSAAHHHTMAKIAMSDARAARIYAGPTR